MSLLATPSAATLKEYEIESPESVLTPALLIYGDKVRHNIETTIALAGGDPNRWRPHIKTAKLAWAMRLLVSYGVTQFKCAPTRELLVACEAGARDVLVAYPHTGANAARIVEIARAWPQVRVSVLVEAAVQIAAWSGSPVGVFIDINPGMDRTGIAQSQHDQIRALAVAIGSAGLTLRGVHYYDGHITAEDFEQRTLDAHRGYDQLLKITDAMADAGVDLEEIITSGTPAFPCALSYPGFRKRSFVHRVSPGTVVYCDPVSKKQLPGCDYEYAAVVLSRVVSHPREAVVTCDAGHKAVSADAGVPTCEVLGRPDLTPQRPSEEHLPLAVSANSAPSLGSFLYLVPRHVCPTVNLFNSALIIDRGRVAEVEQVTARGHERAIRNQSP